MSNSFCPSCGSKVESADSKFCINCGYNFGQVNQNYNASTNANVNYNSYSNIQPTSTYSNGMGVAGFVVSLISLILCCGSLSWLSLIFSIIGMNNAKKNNGLGNGISIAGLCISIIGLLFLILWCFGFIVGFTEGLASL